MIMKWYRDCLATILLRPIYFYTHMEKGPLKDKPVTFLLISCWLFSMLMSAFVFMALILPMVSVLIQGITGPKLAVVIPVFVFFCLIFFLMILMIAAPIIIGAVFAAFLLFSFILHYIAGRFGGVGDARTMIKAVYYSGAVLIPYSLMPVIAAATRYKALTQQNFVPGMNLLAVMTIVYLWGLWSIALRKIYGLSKQKALSASFIAVFLVLLLQMTAGQRIIAVLERWTM